MREKQAGYQKRKQTKTETETETETEKKKKKKRRENKRGLVGSGVMRTGIS